ncbi:MAG: hypothetical protein ACR650_00155 [Methylocystis sp.]
MVDAIAVKVSFDKDIAALLKKAGQGSSYALARALDEVGNKTRTQVIKATAAQAGVNQGKVRGVIRTKQAAGAGGGEYVITARDVTLSLKEFGLRQTASGVSAAPWGKRRVFPHTFVGPSGHVFVRKGKDRLPIHKLFGPNIPTEMVKDEAEKTFYRESEKLLAATVEKWLVREITKAGG